MENEYCIMGRKHCEKRRNCLLQAISPFLTINFHSYISLVCQNAVLCGNGLRLGHTELKHFIYNYVDE